MERPPPFRSIHLPSFSACSRATSLLFFVCPPVLGSLKPSVYSAAQVFCPGARLGSASDHLFCHATRFPRLPLERFMLFSARARISTIEQATNLRTANLRVLLCTILPSVRWFVPEADDLRQEARGCKARHVNLKSSCVGLSFPIPANQPPFERVYCSFQNGFIVLGPFRPARLRAAYNKLTRVTQISSSVLTHALWSIWRWA